MKVLKVWQILGATLLAGTQFAALGSDTTVTVPAAPAAVTTTKAAYTTTKDPTHRLNAKGVPNFGKLNENIWRSGQPSAEGYKYLAGQGLKTVVNLRKEFPGDKDLLPEGVKYVYIPITDEHAPTPEQAKQFLEVASNPDNWPLLVHCHGGEGRAGVMSALVRRSLDGWDFDKTMKETGNYRIKHLGFFTTSMPSCQRTFIQDWGVEASASASP
jgi:protein tyrosine phosphatase (PTP) superfamily phosphohydrolase (DUF442 family)